MNRQKMQYPRHSSAGFTILELLIALSLGIILLLGLMSIYIVAQQADSQNKALNANNEIARQVFRILDDSFQHAGYVDPLDSAANAFPNSGSICTGARVGERYGALTIDVANTNIENIYRRYNNPANALPDSILTSIGRISCGGMQPVLGCGAEAGFSAAPNIFSATPSACSDQGANETKQAIEVAFQAMAVGGHGLSNLNNVSANSTATDCTGTEVTTAQNGFVVNQFFIEEDNGENSFTCQSNLNNTNVALVQGVDEMVFRYITTIQEKNNDIRIGESDSGRVLAAYKTAEQLYDYATNQVNLDWATVVGVEVCIVTSSPRRDNSLATLGRSQGNQRPTCAREREPDGTTSFYLANVDKDVGREDRFYQRFERIFKIPNTLFLSN